MATTRKPQITSDLQAKAAQDGFHSCGDGLYLEVKTNGRKYWVVRYQLNKRRRDYVIGAYPAITMKDARLARNDVKAIIAQGIDPIDRRKEQNTKSPDNTFDRIYTEYIDTHKHGWRNQKHVAQWSATLNTYASPVIGTKDVALITTEDVLKIIKEIWLTKRETASRVRGRIEKVLDYATVKKMREGENPARWRGHMELLLPQTTKRQEHHSAMPYESLPTFYRKIKAMPYVSPLALQWVILTGCRTGEALGAKWDEIDLPNRLWRIPAERMKAGREHIVPITYSMMRVLVKAKHLRLNDWLFPSPRSNKHLSNMSLLMLMREHSPTYTTHGFRSSMTDWFHEKTDVPNEVIELQLSHAIGTKVEQAYRRGNALQKRFDAMRLWSNFLNSSTEVDLP